MNHGDIRFCAEPVREFAPPYKASDTGISLGRIFARSTPGKQACRSPSDKCEPYLRWSRRTRLEAADATQNKREITARAISLLLVEKDLGELNPLKKLIKTHVII